MHDIARALLVRALLLSAAAATATGCIDGWSCTDAGCLPGLQLRLHANGASLPDGRYDIDAAVDGREVPIAFLVRDRTIDCPVDQVACRAEVPADGRTLRAWVDHIESSRRVLEVRVTYLYEPHPEAGAVEDMDLQVMLDGEVVASEALAPEHRLLEPNGPECGPRCLYADAELALEVPGP